MRGIFFSPVEKAEQSKKGAASLMDAITDGSSATGSDESQELLGSGSAVFLDRAAFLDCS